MTSTTSTPKPGRPAVDDTHRKKARAFSLTDAEYQKLLKLASAQKLGVSQFLIKSHKLST